MNYSKLISSAHAALLTTLCFGFLTSQPVCASPSHETLTQALGIPIWISDNLWEENVAEVATRLNWPLESRTEFQSSHRYYPPAKYRILDRRPYSTTLYAAGDKPESISIIFANSGDFTPPRPDPDDRRTSRRADSPLQQALDADAEAIEAVLTELLGNPRRETFGAGRNTRERVSRWDWNGHAILLSVQDDSYVGLRIVTTEFADLGGTNPRIGGRDLREMLAERVIRRDNGDVIVSNIPMVNQGPKGYCVPATWERYLRYLGIPADMYILARAGGTMEGGGTYIHLMNQGVEDMVRRNGRRMETSRGRIDIRQLSRHIDSGLPIMWGMLVNDGLNKEMTQRSNQRRETNDLNEWKAQLDTIRARYRNVRSLSGGGHMCMIIGYNADTQEIATSDSWGPEYAERWITVEEANLISQGTQQIVRW